jgi:hypothetical protein
MLTEAGVRRLVKRVCAELDPETPPPTVVFRDGFKAHHIVYDDECREIRLPSQKWVKRHRACTAMGYRLLVLHEIAHHLFGARHGSAFYSGLFGLCDLYGVPLSFAFIDEHGYKPRAAMQGFDRYVKSLQDRIDILSASTLAGAELALGRSKR